ncbi:ABC transporter substrate-binding protein [Propionibacterium freudenreichii]|uniref:ABC transporter substrate-binding protein n=1 Tax=Propionibacterium freudenreichii TaxID=1744 RepID=UPI002485F696|nr:ABC transporter substrate-binding protein [Propionibacterium freudenreichii]WGU90928.1 ABC transporter substrate-binding protein [Propionibacterium freudenreichii]
MRLPRRAVLGAIGLATLAACSRNDPIGASSSASRTGLVVGSQQYYSNEIIAECYAQVLEASGIAVTRQFEIRQREVYIDEMTSGKIDLIPEYSGNLLQYFNKDTQVTDRDAVREALVKALPASLHVLDQADAGDQDSYTVTRASAQEHSMSSIGDLAALGTTITVAANSEFATRPYGPTGLKRLYGVDATVLAVEDSGGPLTVKALLDGKVQAADIYTADPSIASNDLVVLSDPKHLILAQNVTPLASARVDAAAAAAINKVSAQLGQSELQSLNSQSVTKQLKAADIAREWLRAKSLV